MRPCKSRTIPAFSRQTRVPFYVRFTYQTTVVRKCGFPEQAQTHARGLSLLNKMAYYYPSIGISQQEKGLAMESKSTKSPSTQSRKEKASSAQKEATLPGAPQQREDSPGDFFYVGDFLDRADQRRFAWHAVNHAAGFVLPESACARLAHAQ